MISNDKKIILFPVASHFLFHFYEIAFPALAIPLTLSLNMSLKDVLALGFPMYLMFGLCALPWGFFAPWEMSPMPAGWQMQEKIPIAASDHTIPVGVDDRAVRKEPAAQPKKPIMRARRLLV